MELFYTGILAGLALIFKTTFLLQVVTLSNLTRAFNLVAIGFIFQHAFEFLALMIYGTQPEISETMVSGVLMSAYFICAAFMHLTLTINPILHSREIKFGAWIACTLVSAIHLSGGVVAGIVKTSYSIISVHGPHYAWAQIYIIFMVGAIFLVLAHGYIKGDPKTRRLSSYVGVSVIPIALAAVSILLLRSAGYQSTSAMVLPLVSTYFVWRIMHFELGNIAPLTLRWSVFWFQIRQAIAALISNKDYCISDQFSDLEIYRIRTAMPLCDYNVAAASRLLNMSWSTVDRKCKQFGITEEEIDSPAKTLVEKTPREIRSS